MAMITTDGAEVDLGAGVTRRFIVKSDLTSDGSLLPATTKAQIVFGQLDLSGAAAWEIKSGSALKVYGKAAGATRVGFVTEDLIKSDGENALEIEADAAIACDGYIDYILLS